MIFYLWANASGGSRTIMLGLFRWTSPEPLMTCRKPKSPTRLALTILSFHRPTTQFSEALLGKSTGSSLEHSSLSATVFPEVHHVPHHLHWEISRRSTNLCDQGRARGFEVLAAQRKPTDLRFSRCLLSEQFGWQLPTRASHLPCGKPRERYLPFSGLPYRPFQICIPS